MGKGRVPHVSNQPAGDGVDSISHTSAVAASRPMHGVMPASGDVLSGACCKSDLCDKGIGSREGKK